LALSPSHKKKHKEKRGDGENGKGEKKEIRKKGEKEKKKHRKEQRLMIKRKIISRTQRLSELKVNPSARGGPLCTEILITP